MSYDFARAIASKTEFLGFQCLYAFFYTSKSTSRRIILIRQLCSKLSAMNACDFEWFIPGSRPS